MEAAICWIYHERQQSNLCGQHALNNLLQNATFDALTLSQIAHQLDEVELSYYTGKDRSQRVLEGSNNVDSSGNFSIEVLRAALKNATGFALPNIKQESLLKQAGVKDITEIGGFICHRESHWFAIRLINGNFWNLNSFNEMPIRISHFELAKELEDLQNQGYHVFCAVDVETSGANSLPAPCVGDADNCEARGDPQYWWKESDLLSGKSAATATTRANDHWRNVNVGSGMRLDGRPVNGNSSNTTLVNLDNLTEDEMLNMALQASLVETKHMDNDVVIIDEEEDLPSLTPEPANGIRIQFRFPNNGRVVRKFNGNDKVCMVYSYVKSVNESKIELRAGFPPKDLAGQKSMTIEDAKLAGESIQVRYI